MKFRVSQYVSSYANLLMESGERIKVCIYRKGEYPAPGFWDPGRRVLGIEDIPLEYEYSGKLLSLVVHEVGHIRYTSPGAKGSNNVSHIIANILEDVRVEKKMTEAFPGGAGHLKRSRQEILRERKRSGPLGVLLDTASRVALYNTYDSRLIRDLEGRYRDRAEGAMEDFTDASRKALAVETTEDIIEIAEELYAKWFRPPEKESGDQEKSQGGDSRGMDEGDDSAGRDDSVSGDKNEDEEKHDEYCAGYIGEETQPVEESPPSGETVSVTDEEIDEIAAFTRDDLSWS